jgi:hypothetical protein
VILAWSLSRMPSPPNASLDASWQAMLVRAHGSGMQFGRELIFTWGPWGFLCSVFHLGTEGAWSLILWQTLGQALIAAALIYLTRPSGLGRQAAFVLLMVALHWLFGDAGYFALIVLGVLGGLMRGEASVGEEVAWAAALGFLSQFKFTYFVLAGVGVAATALCWGLRRRWTRSAWGVGAYAGSVLVAWVAAGQNPDNLYPYLRRSLEIARGYGGAMGLDESWPVFLWGVGLAALCAGYVWSVWTSAAERALALPAAGFLGVAFFLMWKESFTRADLTPIGGHVFGLFVLVAVLAPVLGSLVFSGRRWHWFDLSVPYCLVAVGCFDPAFLALGPRLTLQGMERAAADLGRLPALPGAWEREYAASRQSVARPALRSALDGASVDVYDYNLGIALLNDLHLTPRPIFQGYSAYTPSLEEWNLRFYQSDKAPAFLIWSDERLDDRYPGEDDAMLVAGLAGHYEPVFPDGPYWLFRKRAPLDPAPLQRQPLLTRGLAIGEELVLPEERSHALWLRAEAAPNALGRLRAALYKPAALSLVTTDDEGSVRRWRFLPEVGRVGFILVPTLETGADMASFLRGEAHGWIRSLRFEAPSGQEEFWRPIDVSLDALPRIPLRPILSPALMSASKIFDPAPLWVTTAAGQEIFALGGENAVLLHAESHVFLRVPDSAKRVAGTFGLREGAYTGDGHSSGVVFDLDARWANGRRERLWSRALDPVRREGDRGAQHFDIGLPDSLPVQLEMSLLPAVEGDNRWDWSYLAGVRVWKGEGG